MYSNPEGNRELVNLLVNSLLVFCIRKGWPLDKNRQARIGVELYSGSFYKDLRWPKYPKKGKPPAYQITLTQYSPLDGVFRVLKDGKENRSLHKELMQCIEEELALATSHVRSG